MADSQLERQAATYKHQPDKPATHLEREQPPPPAGPRPMSQADRQALTYRNQPRDAAAFKKFTQENGLSEEQARKVVDWLLADEQK